MLTATTTLLGGALGDALGYPVEFIESAAEIFRLYGAAAPAQLLRCFDGLVHVSDDTQMTLFAVEGLVLAGDDPVGAVHAAYQRWLYTQLPDRFERPERGWLLDVQRMFARRAPGNTCLSALVENVQSARTPTVGNPPNDSKGGGAIMRSAPFGLVAESRAQAFAWARDTGRAHARSPIGLFVGRVFRERDFRSGALIVA